MGGTGANHIMLGTGDAIWFSDGNGNPETPPQQSGQSRQCPERRRPAHQCAQRNRKSQSAAGHQQLLYAGRLRRRLRSPTADEPPNANYGGGSYVDCADPTQPGVGGHAELSRALPRKVDPEMRDRALLSPQQLQSRLFRRRHQRLHRHQSRATMYTRSRRPACEHRRPAEREQYLLGLLRRPVQSLSQG